MKNIQVIAFDADDTLWENEPYFQETEKKFCNLLKEYLPAQKVSEELLKTELQDIKYYGYGVKGFILSMLETSLRITSPNADPEIMKRIIELGKEQLDKPVILLDGVKEVLETLYDKYKLVMATKGDLLDQERKLKKSGLEKYFHHIEIMSDKKTSDYKKLINHLNCIPEEFLMIGNSVKSDVTPVLEIGGYSAYVPFHVTWSYEKMDFPANNSRFFKLESIKEIIDILSN